MSMGAPPPQSTAPGAKGNSPGGIQSLATATGLQGGIDALGLGGVEDMANGFLGLPGVGSQTNPYQSSVDAGYSGVDPLIKKQQDEIANQGPLPSGQQARQEAIDAAYGQASSRLDPQFKQAGENMNQELANQGLSPTDAAYKATQDQFSRGKNDAYTSAMNSAIGQGTQAGAEIFREGVTSHQVPFMDLGSLGSYGAQRGGLNLDAESGMANYGLTQDQIREKYFADAMSGLTGGAKGAAQMFAMGGG